MNGPATRTFFGVLEGLVVEQLEVGVPLDRCVDLLAGHPLLDVGVVGDRLQRDVLDPLVDEAVPDVAAESPDAEARSPSATAPWRDPRPSLQAGTTGTRAPMSRWRASASATRDVSISDPPATPLLGNVRGRPGPARRIENEIARVGSTSSMHRSNDLRCSSERHRSSSAIETA